MLAMPAKRKSTGGDSNKKGKAAKPASQPVTCAVTAAVCGWLPGFVKLGRLLFEWKFGGWIIFGVFIFKA